MRDKFDKHVEEVIEATINILKGTVSESDDGGDNPDWQEIYASLIMTEKLLQQFPHYCLQSKLQVGIWFRLCAPLLGFDFRIVRSLVA